MRHLADRMSPECKSEGGARTCNRPTGLIGPDSSPIARFVSYDDHPLSFIKCQLRGQFVIRPDKGRRLRRVC